MIGFLRRYRQGLIISMAIVFLIGIFVGLGGYFFTGADHSEAVAMIGRAKISYFDYRARVNQILDRMRSSGDVSEQAQNEVKEGVLREMIVDELLAKAAEEMGLRVSDAELSLAIQGTPAFQRDGKFDQDTYFQIVRGGLRTSTEKFEREQRRSMLGQKLKLILFRASKVAAGEARAEYARANKGSMQGFEKAESAFAQELRQRRAVDTVNIFLKDISSKVPIRSYLAERERGMS